MPAIWHIRESVLRGMRYWWYECGKNPPRNIFFPMPYQWRQPVETQNFASPDQRTHLLCAYSRQWKLGWPCVSRVGKRKAYLCHSLCFNSIFCLWDARFCVSTFCRQRYKTQIRTMPLQRRQPVETQNFASHKQRTHLLYAYYRQWKLGWLACETQDFASLLFAHSVIKQKSSSCHYNGVSL